MKNSAKNAPLNVAKKGKKKSKVVLRVFLVFITLIVLLLAASFIFLTVIKNNVLNKINYIPTIENPTMINEEGSVVSISDVIVSETTVVPIPEFEYIHNILLIGTDSRGKSYSEDGSGHLADVIIIMSINENDNTIKMMSIARDNFVYIPGYTDPQKINTAMTYGGPELLMIAIENSLRIELEEYAYVNFYHMEKVVNAVGGVYVNVSEDERTLEGGLNECIREQNLHFGSEEMLYFVETAGTQLLNGRQAVAYARIRKVGNGDYGRSKRQIEVLQSLLKQFNKLSITKKIDAVETIASQVSTNITKEKLEWYAFTFLANYSSTEFEYLQLPIDEYSNQGMYYDFVYGQWSIRPDWNGMIPLVQEFIFGETFPVDPVREIPGAPGVE
jgi:LCP family protein required for cell wall assembly